MRDMSERSTACEHGVVFNGGVGRSFFGVPCTCRCCRSLYVPIDSSTGGDVGLISSRTFPRDLCRPCGGVPVEYLHPDYERVDEGGVFRLRRRGS